MSRVTRRPHLLLIEDHRDTLVATARLLTLEGFDVTIARSGDEGLEKAHHARPDVIVTDVAMRKVSGRDVCQRLGDAPDLRSIPVIAYTGIIEPQMLASLFRAGVRVFAIKPCMARVLANEARTVIDTGNRAAMCIVTGYGETLDHLTQEVKAYVDHGA
jgi:CheY-like chemotaxis protein